MLIKVYDRNSSDFESITFHVIHNAIYRAEHYHRGQYREAHEFYGMNPVRANNILTVIAEPGYTLVRSVETD